MRDWWTGRRKARAVERRRRAADKQRREALALAAAERDRLRDQNAELLRDRDRLAREIREAEATLRVQEHELRTLWAALVRNLERVRAETAAACEARSGGWGEAERAEAGEHTR